MSDLAFRLGVSPGALHAEVERLVSAGLVSDRFEGRNRLLRADTSSRIARPPTEILMVTFGPEMVVAEEFCDTAGADQVVIHGSRPPAAAR